jgi:hypothetical protein
MAMVQRLERFHGSKWDGMWPSVKELVSADLKAKG